MERLSKRLWFLFFVIAAASGLGDLNCMRRGMRHFPRPTTAPPKCAHLTVVRFREENHLDENTVLGNWVNDMNVSDEQSETPTTRKFFDDMLGMIFNEQYCLLHEKLKIIRSKKFRGTDQRIVSIAKKELNEYVNGERTKIDPRILKGLARLLTLQKRLSS